LGCGPSCSLTSRALRLQPDALGVALAAFSLAGIATLVAGGRLADRLGRRPVFIAGSGGLGLFFLGLTTVRSFPVFAGACVVGGLCASLYDLAVNTLGGDYERAYDTRAMTLLHAGFSAGAAFGAIASAVALGSGLTYRTVSALAGALLLALAVLATRLPLPPVAASAPLTSATTDNERGWPTPLWRVPGVLLALAIVGVCFFGDGALEGYTSVYLRTLLGAGALLGGLGIAAFHLASLAGRLGGAALIRRYGERAVVTAGGLGAALGIGVAVATATPVVAVAGLLLVGPEPRADRADGLLLGRAVCSGARGTSRLARHAGRVQRLHRQSAGDRRPRQRRIVARGAAAPDRDLRRRRRARPPHPIDSVVRPLVSVGGLSLRRAHHDASSRR